MRRPLAEDVSKQPQQADDEIHEDQLLNFLVNVLTGAFTLDLGENAEIDPEDIFDHYCRSVNPDKERGIKTLIDPICDLLNRETSLKGS